MFKFFTISRMLFILSLVIFSLAVVTLSQPIMAANDTKTLEQRLSALESLIIETKAQDSNLESLIIETAAQNDDNDNKLKVSGYADIEITQSSAANNPSRLNLHHMALIFKQRLSEKLRYNTEIEFQNAPYIKFESSPETCDDCKGQIFIESLTVDYTASNHTDIRIGRFFTPVGIWSVNHYPPFVATQLRPGNTHEIYPHTIDGVNIMGTLASGNNTFINYDLFTGNGAKPSTSNGGLKINLILPWFSVFETGTSAFIDHVPNGTDTSTQTAYSFHLKSTIGSLNIQAELSNAHYQQASSADFHKMGYYVQMQYHLDKHWSFGTRHDHFENTSTNPAETKNNLTSSLFTNYRIDHNTVLKLEHHIVNDVVDYQTTIASIAVNLGN